MPPEHRRQCIRRQVAQSSARKVGFALSDDVVAAILEREELGDEEISQLVPALSIRSQVYRRQLDPEMVAEALTPIEGQVERERKEKGISQIFYAIWDCDQEQVESLIAQGADLEVINPQSKNPHTQGMTPLLDSLYQRDAGMVGLLLEAGADPSNRGRHSAYPVHLATANRQCLERILEAGAEPNALDSEGKTPLMWAARRDWLLPQVEALLAAGADPVVATPEGSTALSVAEESGAAQVAARLQTSLQSGKAGRLSAAEVDLRPRPTSGR